MDIGFALEYDDSTSKNRRFRRIGPAHTIVFVNRKFCNQKSDLEIYIEQSQIFPSTTQNFQGSRILFDERQDETCWRIYFYRICNLQRRWCELCVSPRERLI
jgi:hypothetical protein